MRTERDRAMCVEVFHSLSVEDARELAVRAPSIVFASKFYKHVLVDLPYTSSTFMSLCCGPTAQVGLYKLYEA